jgi:outer membrane protein TolC
MAELYPKLTLSGSIGVDALTPAQMSSGNWTASGGPRLSWAIFDTALRPNIEIQSALQEQALFAYRSAVLEALREVEDALVTHVEERQRTAALLSATQAAREAATLAEYKYRSGLADFQNVLDAERSFLSFQDQLIRANATVTSTVVRLYKALGGGWIPMDVAVAPSQTP